MSWCTGYVSSVHLTSLDPDRNTCIIHVVADHEFFRGPGNNAEALVCGMYLVA